MIAHHTQKSIIGFQKSVYRATRKIPRGKVATYAYIALVIGKPKAVRAVGNALNRNPFAPIVPCHRVVRSDFSVGGFAGGTAAKIRLLKKEGVHIHRGRFSTFCLFAQISKR